MNSHPTASACQKNEYISALELRMDAVYRRGYGPLAIKAEKCVAKRIEAIKKTTAPTTAAEALALGWVWAGEQHGTCPKTGAAGGVDYVDPISGDTVRITQTIEELKERVDHAFGAIASKALAMVQSGALDVATCHSELTRRSIAYLRSQADYAEAIGLSVMAGNYRDEADAMEGDAK